MNESYNRKIQFLESPLLSLEIIDLLCGEFIGSGCSRQVFECSYNKDWVVKIENGGKSGDNFSEWNIWNSVKYTENAKWFAPCILISENGMVLIQKKTNLFYSKSEKIVPDKIPAMFTDLHTKNFGWIGKQLVAHDYAFCLAMSLSSSAVSKQMQSTKNKLKWS